MRKRSAGWKTAAKAGTTFQEWIRVLVPSKGALKEKSCSLRGGVRVFLLPYLYYHDHHPRSFPLSTSHSLPSRPGGERKQDCEIKEQKQRLVCFHKGLWWFHAGMFAGCMWMNICSTPVKAIKAAWKNAKTCSRNGFSGTVHGQKSQRETH